MMLQSILEIWRLSLELALEAVRSVPEPQRAAFWERHERRMERLDRLFNRNDVLPLVDGGPGAVYATQVESAKEL
jgi:hypothetical protein